MKLRMREKFILAAVVTIALAMPLSLWLTLMQSKETRTQASSAEIYVVPDIADCATYNKTEGEDCFDVLNDAVAAGTTYDDSVVLVKAGQYYQPANIQTDSSFSMTIRGEGTDKTVISDPSNTLSNGHVFSINSVNANIRFEDLVLSESGGDTIVHVYNAERVDLSNVVIVNGPTAGIYYSSSTEGFIEDSYFENNVWPGVSLSENSSVTVVNSQFHNHPHAAVDVNNNDTGAASLKVVDSIFSGNNSLDEDGTEGTLRLAGSSNTKIINSKISTSGNQGIVLVDNAQAVVYNNVLESNSSSGIKLFNDTNAAIVNSTFVANDHNQIDAFDNSSYSVINNIVVNGSRGGIRAESQSNIESAEYNNVWGNADAGWNDWNNWPPESNLSVDPDFVGDGSYQLTPDSTLLNAGKPSVPDPDDSISQIGAWGGPDADWHPRGDMTYTCADGFSGEIYDYNDKERIWGNNDRYIGELWYQENGEWNPLGDSGEGRIFTTSDDNFEIAMPERFKDGIERKVILVGYNVYKYTDSNAQEVVYRNPDSFTVDMNVFVKELQVTCGTAVNTPPSFVEEPEDQMAYIGEVFSYGIAFEDDDGDYTTLSVTLAPELSWIEEDTVESDNGLLVMTGTPPQDAPTGEFLVDLELDDGTDVVEDSFTVTVDERPIDDPVLSLRIDLQVKEDDSNDSVNVKVFDIDELKVFDSTTASNEDGFLSTVVLEDMDPGEYDIWVKPKGYLARRIRKTLVVGENRFTMPEEFLAGDLHEAYTWNIVKAADYSVLAAKYFQEDEYRNLDGDPLVNAKDATILTENWFTIGEAL